MNDYLFDMIAFSKVAAVAGYDRNSNRQWRENTVAAGFDHAYTYDDLNRLTYSRHGTLNGSHEIPDGADLTFRQQWGLDPVGNWHDFDEDDTGGAAPSWSLEQARTNNRTVNEPLGRSEVCQ